MDITTWNYRGNHKSKKVRKYNGQKKKDQQWFTKYYRENLRLTNMNLTKNHKYHFSCYQVCM
jgi:hypothetical protein